MSKKVLFTSKVSIRPLGSGGGGGGEEWEWGECRGGARLGNSFHFFQKQTQLLNLHPTVEFIQPV